MIQLERDWQYDCIAQRWMREEGWDGIERFASDDAEFLGSRVAEGICPNLHGSDDDPKTDEEMPVRLLPHRGADGTWAECPECLALWRFRAAAQVELADLEGKP